MTSTAWANPYYLHPWFKMPSLKRKELSSDEEDAPTTPIRAASLDHRRSLSPAPSPKRRRCDVLESGMSQLTLDGRPIPPSPAQFAPGQFPSVTPAAAFPTAPTVQYPDALPPATPQWTDARLAPNVTQLPTTAVPTSVVLPGSVEEPTSPETVVEEEEADAPEVSMKVPSWYEIEKDRTSTLPPSSSPPTVRRPARPTVVDASSSSGSSESGDTGIVITDLEDSDSEDSDAAGAKARSTPTADADADSPQFTISSALLDRLPKPHTLGPLAPESSSANNALVLYRPLPIPVKTDEDEDTRTPREEEDSPSIEEVVETEDVPVMEDEPIPMDDQIEFTPIVESVGEPADEPMDIEML